MAGAIDRGLASAAHTLGFVAVVVTVTLELAIGLLVVKAELFVRLHSGRASGRRHLLGGGPELRTTVRRQATDPSTGPLLVVLGLTALGATRADAGGPTFERSPTSAEFEGPCRPMPDPSVSTTARPNIDGTEL